MKAQQDCSRPLGKFPTASAALGQDFKIAKVLVGFLLAYRSTSAGGSYKMHVQLEELCHPSPSAHEPCLQCVGMPSCASQSILQSFVLQNPQPRTKRVIDSHSVLGNRAVSGKLSALEVTQTDAASDTGMGISPRSRSAAPRSIINSLIIDNKFKFCSKRQKALREAEKIPFARKALKNWANLVSF